MSLYQTSVLKSYINLQEDAVIEKAYKKYVKYFFNPTIQENIRSSKEEEYQGIFLTELFVNILGYTLKPKANFNLVAEYKNQTNSRKADGAILHNNIAIGVIELKGTKTKDLESIRKQAFDYKANQKGCVYVITSNFEKLRFYINDATEFEEFNLFELTKERFQLFYLCLQKDNIINNVPLKIKEASIVQEEKITKDFYKDYSLFKRELYRDLVKQNAKRLKSTNVISSAVEKSQEQLQLEKNVKLTLFKKSQKLIDRFLFIFFAEDRSLLPANSTELILEKWKADIDFGDERPLYNLFKQYFHFLDQGRQGTKSRGEIYAYNGGLFKEDTLLDGLIIDNELLYKHTHKLAGYDFESQVDVNILGHIFENSLNEIESVNAEIEGADFDKQTSKRKKDGVFYTPKYITKYIVENTVGKLCTEKKTELGIKEEEYFKGRKNRNKTTITKLVDLLDTYRDWLLQLTICDPACGSGAFLNQALNFLIAEHTYIDELKTKVLGGGFQFSDIENTILENNIFGVDLNEESVEIAKLSLWLRTAQPRRKLNDLSSNIKCGNSLIDAKTVAGDKAFHWETQFPQVFNPSLREGTTKQSLDAKKGFDVIIGNPPYVQITEYKEFYNKKFETSKCGDLYALFYEQGIKILKEKGCFSFITPSLFIKGIRYAELRNFLLNNTEIIEILDKGDGVFQDVQMPTAIVVANKFKVNNQDWNRFIPNGILINKIKKDSIELEKITKIKRGLEIGKDKVNEFNSSDIKIITGEDVARYNIRKYQSILSETYNNYKKDEIFFNSERIIIRETGNRITSLFVNENVQQNRSLYSILIHNDEFKYQYLLSIINSSLIQFFYKSKFAANTDVFPKIRIAQVKELPIKKIEKEKQEVFVSKAILMLNLNKKISILSNKFQNYLKQKFQLEKLPKKLQNWQDLEFGDFVKELNKAIKLSNKQRLKDNLQEIPALTKKDEFEWLDLFEENKQKAQALQTQINQTDKEIDAMVYELYGLTDDEISIVENS
ncbi:MAG: TaqI-like C-terminal specificity domain-containing protein [Polaribacter sp.]|uniref:Eco57I restriction-modification methylase domain-containing protein n=1 Tax=Polaribacter sp. TaxID=1920175 RepID=UPI003267F5A6